MDKELATEDMSQAELLKAVGLGDLDHRLRAAEHLLNERDGVHIKDWRGEPDYYPAMKEMKIGKHTIPASGPKPIIKYEFNIVGDHYAHWRDLDLFSFTVHHVPAKHREALCIAWETGEPLKDPYVVEFKGHSHQACQYCKDGKYLFDGYTLTALNSCPYPNGIPCEIELDVPSGRIVIGNDYRDKFPGKTGKDFDVNASWGIHETVKDHEADQMAHFFVGNSCPGIHKTGENTLIIANPPYDDDYENQAFSFEAEELGSVCTDLWWVSMVDGDEADRRGLEYPGWSDTVVNVEPGRYKITYNGMLRSFNRDSDDGVIFATVQKA